MGEALRKGNKQLVHYPAGKIVIYRDGFNEYGAKIKWEIADNGREFRVSEIQEFYNRNGGREDYDVIVSAVPSLVEALAIAGF